jgi:hypothetical protein
MPGLSYRRNTRAAIEGLPLYLLIIIIITAVSIGIVMGLLNMAKPPQTLGDISLSIPVVETHDDGTGTYVNSSFSLNVTVTDGSGNRISGAVVTLGGNSIKMNGAAAYLTTKDGKASFSQLSCSLVGTGTNPIVVTIEKSGYGKKTIELPVVKA